MPKTAQLFLFSICLLTIACSQEKTKGTTLAHIQNVEVKELLTKVFEAAGGLDNWNAIESVEYHKRFALYREDSTLEKSVGQIHLYRFQPKTFIEIFSKEADQEKSLRFEEGKIEEIVNEVPNTAADQRALTNQLQSSLFVFGLPFKLADQGAQLSYDGKRKLDTGETVHVLKAVYDPVANAHHTTPDIWRLYFDEQTYLLQGYMVQHKDHFSLVKNIQTEKVNGFTFPIERKSYRVDANGNILYLRAEYEYGGFEINK